MDFVCLQTYVRNQLVASLEGENSSWSVVTNNHQMQWWQFLQSIPINIYKNTNKRLQHVAVNRKILHKHKQQHAQFPNTYTDFETDKRKDTHQNFEFSSHNLQLK